MWKVRVRASRERDMTTSGSRLRRVARRGRRNWRVIDTALSSLTDHARVAPPMATCDRKLSGRGECTAG
ncbi:hypothetical protein FGB62_132g012 [Gracilaria domingensis]|nr:hypothetical protein FGB62_132g012 [Gracilaria domingensis]